MITVKYSPTQLAVWLIVIFLFFIGAGTQGVTDAINMLFSAIGLFMGISLGMTTFATVLVGFWGLLWAFLKMTFKILGE